ncbi:N-acetyltransferase family protein [Arsenicicoccus dermatophilus]|uniref:GNAT family N-acetyltransferase n=1 Tax=Arsenicicoccus dermatophilus TaxID=1076331 RepID=UPI003916F15C
MTELTVRVLTDNDWELYKRFRLASLQESPEAFAATFEAEVAWDDQAWHERMQRATRLVAELDGKQVGVGSVRAQAPREGTDDAMAEFFGMWVSPQARGKGVGVELVRAAAGIARSMDCRHLAYWVGTDNGVAVAFASSYGFRVTDTRRPMVARGESPGDADEDEMMMILPLADDPGAVASTSVR